MELDTVLKTKMREELGTHLQRLKKTHRSKNTYLACEYGLGIQFDETVVTYRDLHFPGKKFGSSNKMMKFAVLEGRPTNGELSFAKILYHGSSENDKQRKEEQKYLGELTKKLYEMGYRSIEILGDGNVTLAQPKDESSKPDDRTFHSAFKIDIDTLGKMAENITGLNGAEDQRRFKLKSIRIGTHIVEKGRIFGNPWANHQAAKGVIKEGEGVVEGEEKEIDLKAVSFELEELQAGETHKEIKESIKQVLAALAARGIPNPESRIHQLKDFGEPSDHSPLENAEAENTEYADPANLGLYPEMGTAGKTGFTPELSAYRRRLTVEDKKLQSQAGHAMFQAVRAALFEAHPTIKERMFELTPKKKGFKKVEDLNYAEFFQFIHKDAAASGVLLAGNRNVLRDHLWNDWVNTDLYRSASELLRDECQCLKTKEDVNALVNSIIKDIGNTISEKGLKYGQTAGGYPAMESDPRAAQLFTLFRSKAHVFGLTENDLMTPEEEALDSVKIRGHRNTDSDMRDVSEARDLQNYLNYLKSRGVQEAEYNQDKEYQEPFFMRITLEALRKKVRDVYMKNYSEESLPDVDALFNDNNQLNSDLIFQGLAKLALSEENADIACALVEHERIKPLVLKDVLSRFVAGQALTPVDLAVIAGVPEIQAAIEDVMIRNMHLSDNDLSILAALPSVAKKLVNAIMTAPENFDKMEAVVSKLMQDETMQRLFVKDLILRAWLAAKEKRKLILTEKDVALINKFDAIVEKLAFKFSEIEDKKVRAELLNQPKMYQLLAKELLARGMSEPTPVDKEIMGHASWFSFAPKLEIKEGKEIAEQEEAGASSIADALEAVLMQLEKKQPTTQPILDTSALSPSKDQGMLSQFESGQRNPVDNEVPKVAFEEVTVEDKPAVKGDSVEKAQQSSV